MQVDLGKRRLHMQQDIPRSIKKAKIIVKRDTCMKIYDAARPLHLENDDIWNWPWSWILQVRDSMIYRYDEVPNNATLQSIAFASKRLSNVEQHYSNTEYGAWGILHRIDKFHLYCFTIMHHHLSQAIDGHTEQR